MRLNLWRNEPMVDTRRLSMALVLENLRRRGFLPGTVLDVGAHVGTPLLTLAFPAAHHVMLEPLVEHGLELQALCDRLASAEYLILAAGQEDGSLRLEIDNQTLHGRVAAPNEGPSAKKERLVRSVRLDRLAWEKDLKGPFLIKIDVDGSELDVLKGATGLMNEDSVFIVEVTLFSDRGLKTIPFLDGFDFVPFDIADPLYRESDDALWQADFVFVHRNSFLRRHRGYP